MKIKYFMIESGYWLGMIVALCLTVHVPHTYAQTGTYRISCAVIHDHGGQCFEEVARWTTLEIIDTPKDSIVYKQDFAVDSTTWAGRLVTEEITPQYGWITDSITWVATDTTFKGDCKCEHDWCFDKTNPGGVSAHHGLGKLVEHEGNLIWREFFCFDFGTHCNEHQSATREKICRKCLFSVIEREKWFQHFIAPPKSEFEILKEKQRAKQ